MTKEIWKPIKAFPYHRISNLGRVKSYIGARPKVLKGGINSHGYRIVALAENKKLYIHRLVLEAFVGLCPKGYVTNHKNGNKLDNRLENLEWITPSENTQHAYRLGLMTKEGEDNSNTRLKSEDILEIRKLAELGVPFSTIAKNFSVTYKCIYDIINRFTWSHI